VHLEPLANWCNTDYVEKRVHKIDADNNKVIFEDKTELSYDALGLNVGSKTRGAKDVAGVEKHSLTTRPINDLLGKVERKEEQLIRDNIIPKLAVCGAGAAGIELSFAFKNRWSKLFKQDIKTTLICSDSDIMLNESKAARDLTKAKLHEHGITIVPNAKVENIEEHAITLKDGRVIPCNVPVWATGAEPQIITVRSNLAVLDNYF
jgi:NADH dehydrogenase FAD-containing subunit